MHKWAHRAMQTTPPPTWADPIYLDVGDLVTYYGEAHEKDSPYSQDTIKAENILVRRIVYRVVKREVAPATSYSKWRYTFQVAFDPLMPGERSKQVVQIGSRWLKKLTLVDLGMLRMNYDNFIKDVTRQLSAVEPAEPDDHICGICTKTFDTCDCAQTGRR